MTTAIDRLLSELQAETEGQPITTYTATVLAGLHGLRAEFASLTERLDKAEKDAARYRWLRRQPDDASAPRIDICFWQCNGDDSVNEGECLRLEAADTAIDTAIAQEGADHE